MSSPDDQSGGHDLTPFSNHAAVVPGEARAEPTINFGRYLSALKRYRWLMLAIVLTGTASAVVGSRFVDLKYQAESTLWVQQGGGKGGPIEQPNVLDMQGYSDLLRTDAVFEPVIHRLRMYVSAVKRRDDRMVELLFKNFEIAEKFSTGKFTLAIGSGGSQWTLERSGKVLAQGQAGDSIGSKIGWRWAPTAAELGKRKREVKFRLRSPQEVVKEMNQDLKAVFGEKSSFIRIGMIGRDKDQIAAVVNALCDEFVALAADLKRRNLTAMRALLDSQVIAAQTNLRNSESRLKGFQVNTITAPRAGGILPMTPGLASTTNAVQTQYNMQRVELERLRQDREQLQAVLERSKSGDITADAFQTIPSVNTAIQLKSAISDLVRTESERDALLFRYTPEHRLVIQNQVVLTDLRTRRIPELAQALVTQLKSQEADLEARLALASTELRQGPAITITEMALTRDYQIDERLYQGLAASHAQAVLAELSAIPDIAVLDPAVTPTKPLSNDRLKLILMGFGASLGAAIALALLLDQIDRRFRYPEQVSSGLGLAILGAVPAIRKTRGGELPQEQAAQVVEAFRTIRLNLAHSYGAAGPVMLTISSPGAGDGKSLVSSNLAVSFAEAGYRTLLIDGDIRRGELHRMFAVDRRPGLLDHLAGQATLEDTIRQTSQRGLAVMPCGTRRYRGPELLGSAAMAELMAVVKTQFDVILVDSPPLGAGIDPFVLGTTTGHLMLVFRSGETDRQMAEAKLRLLDRLPVRVLGAVLNEVQADGAYRYYTYLYGYSSDEEPNQLTASAGAKGES
ncbi:MAG: polysaccharide biosynthesis tyrosine autokinase [Gemmatimonadales bacterium]